MIKASRCSTPVAAYSLWSVDKVSAMEDMAHAMLAVLAWECC